MIALYKAPIFFTGAIICGRKNICSNYSSLFTLANSDFGQLNVLTKLSFRVSKNTVHCTFDPATWY